VNPLADPRERLFLEESPLRSNPVPILELPPMSTTDFRRRVTGTLCLIGLAAGLAAATPLLAAPRAVLGELFSAEN
jgi:hypothetical protein